MPSISASLGSNALRAFASGCGLLAAQSFHKGEEGRGFGAPVVVSGLFVIVLKGQGCDDNRRANQRDDKGDEYRDMNHIPVVSSQFRFH